MPHLAPEAADAYAIAPAPMITRAAAGRIEHTDSGGAAPVLLTLHGGMGGCDQSWLLARALASDLAAFRVIAVSRPGYLGTPLEVGRSPEAQADAIAALLDALAIPKALVAAVSAGGPTALQFALRHPDRCTGLVMVSAASGPLVVPEYIASRLATMRLLGRLPGFAALLASRARRNPRAAARRSIEDPALLDSTLAHPQAGPLIRVMMASVFDRLTRRVPGTIADIKAYDSMEPFPFERLRTRVLVIHGVADRIVPVAHARAVSSRTPGARNVEIAGGDHVTLFTHLEAVRAAFSAFAEAVSGPEGG